ncbi:unnamed protein product, partial [Pocillopora meandrina]
DLKEDIDAHRDPFKQLKVLAFKITDVCLQEDVTYIDDTIRDLDARWKELTGLSSGRKKDLDENYKLSHKFFKGAEELLNMLDAAERSLKDEEPIGVDPAHLRSQLKKHKEFQSMLGANQTSMDGIIKTGKVLMEKSPGDDAIIIEGKIADLKARWDAICALSVERQQKLEEALLFTGMFQDALQSLLDWLSAVEPSLSTETAVMGDPETVQILIDNHKTFQRELGRRQANYDSVMNTGRTMINENKVEDPHKLEERLDDLRMRWEAISALSNTKQDRLDNALVLAKEFDTAVKTELRILKDFEDTLRGLGPIADDLETIADQLSEHKVFHEDLMAEEVNVQSAIKKGQVIARFCHPSALPIIQQWIARLKKRWDEVRKWSVQRLTRLEEEQSKLTEEQSMMEELLQWIGEKEEILIEKENEPIPDDDYEQVMTLLEDHKGFQEEMAKKQPTYDRLTKSVKRRGSKLTLVTSPGSSFTRSGSTTLDKNHPALLHLSKRWQHLWLLSMERLRRLQEKLERIAIRRASAKFDFNEWKSRFNKWLRDSKSRVLDIFRRMDQGWFIVLCSERRHLTSRLSSSTGEYRRVPENLCNYNYWSDTYSFHQTKKPEKPKTEEQQIQSEIERLCRKCGVTFVKVAENKYRFGDSQKMRLVRILRSTVMVRVGGGWETLEEFLLKNEPSKATGRTNIELREQLSRPEGVTQTMGAFTSKRHSEQKSTVSGELRPPSGPTKQRSGTNLKGTAEKSPSTKRPSGVSRVRKSDSQTSLGSTGSLEDSSEGTSPRVSSGIPSSPSSTSSRGSPDRPGSAASKSATKSTGMARTGSRENVRGSRESL